MRVICQGTRFLPLMASLSNVDDVSRPKSRGRSFAGWMSDSEYMNELSLLCSEVSVFVLFQSSSRTLALSFGVSALTT